MDNSQILTAALAAVPTMLTVLVSMLINNSRLTDMNGRFNDMNARLGKTNARISELRARADVRFDEMRDLWRSELYRVEQVIDARLKHLEERSS